MAEAANSAEIEIWKPVAGWEALYAVSSLGRVKRLAREVELSTRWGGVTVRHLPERIITLRDFLGRYWQVDLKRRPIRKTVYVHRLVCEAFHGPPPDGCEVAHSDGDGKNNAASNLRWATTSENHLDKRLHGTSAEMATVPNALVPFIRALPDSGLDRTLAVALGVTRATIQHIRLGYSRKWID